MEKVTVTRIVVGSFQVNCYLVSCPKTDKCVIIDPGGDTEKILQSVNDNGLQVQYILNTHGHSDHVVSNRSLGSTLSVPVCMHEEDDAFFANPEVRIISKKELGLEPPAPVDKRLKDKDVLDVGTLQIKVIHTPGHSPGSVCYLVSGNLFTGDTLFVGDVGRTDLVGGSLETLLASIKNKILPLPDSTLVWPGHDYGEMTNSTLAWEKAENPYITDFILAEK